MCVCEGESVLICLGVLCINPLQAYCAHAAGPLALKARNSQMEKIPRKHMDTSKQMSLFLKY